MPGFCVHGDKNKHKPVFRLELFYKILFTCSFLTQKGWFLSTLDKTNFLKGVLDSKGFLPHKLTLSNTPTFFLCLPEY